MNKAYVFAERTIDMNGQKLFQFHIAAICFSFTERTLRMNEPSLFMNKAYTD